MFEFLKRKKATAEAKIPSSENDQQSIETSEETKKRGFFQRLKQGLQKTRNQFTQGVANLVLGKKIIDTDLLQQLEDLLLLSDMGVEVSQKVIGDLTDRITRHQLDDSQALLTALREELLAILTPCQKPLNFATSTTTTSTTPLVILVVGVNGVGKTTTIGKIAKYCQQQGKKVMLAAGDTFRAAAIEQLQVWGERNNIPVIAQQANADSASVIYDALQAAKARNMDILLADTAGRLHTKTNLMEELKKIRRVMAKLDPTAPHEVLLVLDAGNGQNALTQARQFHEALNLTGLIITKLDGTAKGGVIFAIAKSLAIPICFIGVGEGIDDLRPFVAEEFVSALFADSENERPRIEES
jgi:fused signal recognition particle receptor